MLIESHGFNVEERLAEEHLLVRFKRGCNRPSPKVEMKRTPARIPVPKVFRVRAISRSQGIGTHEVTAKRDIIA